MKTVSLYTPICITPSNSCEKKPKNALHFNGLIKFLNKNDSIILPPVATITSYKNNSNSRDKFGNIMFHCNLFFVRDIFEKCDFNHSETSDISLLFKINFPGNTFHFVDIFKSNDCIIESFHNYNADNVLKYCQKYKYYPNTNLRSIYRIEPMNESSPVIKLQIFQIIVIFSFVMLCCYKTISLFLYRRY